MPVPRFPRSLFSLLIAAPLSLSGDEVLDTGQAVAGRVSDGDPVITTPSIEAAQMYEAVVGPGFTLDVEPGPVTLSMRSAWFDGCLFVLDEQGSVIAEDNDGWFADCPRVTFDAMPDERYRVLVGALYGGRGPFTLEARSGAPDPLPANERVGLEVALWEEAAGVFEQVDATSAAVAVGLGRIGMGYLRLQAFDRARPLLARALEVSEAVDGPSSRRTLEALNNLGTAVLLQGDYLEARAVLERTLEAKEAALGPDDLSLAVTRVNLVQPLLDAGEVSLAAEHATRAIEIAEAATGTRHRELASSWNALARARLQQGDLESALELTNKSIELLEREVEPPDLVLMISNSNRADILARLGRYDEARAAYERLLPEMERFLPPDHPNYARARAGYAFLLMDLGDTAAARSRFEEVHRVLAERLGATHPDTIRALGNLGVAHNRLGDSEAARRISEEVLALSTESRGAGEGFEVGRSLSNLASVVMEPGGDAEGAREMLLRALEIASASVGERHGLTAAILYNLGRAEAMLGNLDASRNARKQALAIDRELLGRAHASTLTSLLALAQAEVDRDDLEGAWAVLGEAELSAREQLDSVTWSLTERERILYARKKRETVEMILTVASRLGSDVDRAAYAAVLEWKGRAMRELTASRRAIAARTDAAALDELDRLAEIDERLSRAYLEPGARDARELDGLLAERDRLQRELLKSAGAARLGGTPDDVRAALPGTSALVDVFVHRFYRPAVVEDGEVVVQSGWTDPVVSAWVTRADRPGPTHVSLGRAGALEGALERHRPTASGEDREASATELRALWEPLLGHLAGAETVFVSMDRFLGGLPLEVLRSEDGTYLVEDHGFVYLPHALALVELSRGSSPDPESPSLVAVGGVDYGGERAFLPHTLLEVEAIEGLFREVHPEAPKPTVLRGAEATEERVLGALPQSTTVHLATHGFFDSEDDDEFLRTVGLRSGIALAPGGSVLTAEELSWRDLSGVDLVVLSACDTGLGHAEAGEGMLGLRRMLHQSGVRTVVSSLWAVPEQRTRELMESFYRHLWVDGMGKGAALRRAQLEMIERGLPPSEWGAFVLSGDWR